MAVIERKGTGGSDLFDSTRWSLVVSACSENSDQALAALEELCQIYWPPVHAYVRRRTLTDHDAEDMTQEFFRRLLAGELLDLADRNKGKFRAFMLTSVRNFLVNESTWRGRLKRGGGQLVISLDHDAAREQIGDGRGTDLSPDEAFDVNWASVVLSRAIEALHREQEAKASRELFYAVRECLEGQGPRGVYAEIAELHDTTREAVAKFVQRLRNRLRDLVREQVADTVSHPGQTDEELKTLQEIIRTRR